MRYVFAPIATAQRQAHLGDITSQHSERRSPGAFKYLWNSWIVILSYLAAVRITGAEGVDAAAMVTPAGIEPVVEKCPENCEQLFRKLQDGTPGGGKVQHVEIQVRGEPKSGTGMTAEWAWGAIAHACVYLQRVYGERACRIVWDEEPDNPDIPGNPHSIIFEPALAADDESAPCTCDSVERVQILLSAVRKHMLPVDSDCAWSHRRGVTKPGDTVCQRADGTPVTNQAELWQCADDYNCPFNDDRLQLAVLRDPRAVTVSSYFQLIRQNSPRAANEMLFNSVDDFFQAHLADVCMWLSLRYFLFTQLMPERSAVFWYEEATSDPVDWHGRYYAFIGLHLPPDEVVAAARIASQGGSIMGFPSKGIDLHPGGEEQTVTRTFRDELNERSLAFMDDVLRLWLPPVILDRFGLLVPS